MKCTKCGNEFEGNFCSNCGTPILVTQKKCSKCGAIYSGNFCPKGCNSPHFQAQKKKKGRGGIVAIVIIGIFAFAATMGILFGEETPSDTDSTPANTSSVELIEYIEVTANDLYAAFEDNEVKAEQTYSGKNIKITGTINEINSAETFSSANVLLNVDNTFVGCVQCCFNSSEDAKALANLKKGQSVTITGVCGKLELWNVMVTGCEVQ